MISYLLVLLMAGTVNVRDYGATGNGATDDTKAIQSAINAAVAQHKNLYFPVGVYLCNKINAAGNILEFPVGGSVNQVMYGDPGAVIKTTNTLPSCLLYVYAYARATGFSINNLAFVNTHGKMVGTTNAIFETGTPQNLLDTTYIQNCSFTGFSRAINGQGVVGWWITKNTFTSPNGHDNAEQNNNPAVCIWFADNANGFCRHVYVEQNTASGYTGPLPLNCPRPMDGFVYGFAYDLTIVGNYTRNFSQEYYYIQPPTTNPGTTDSVKIFNNYLDCTLPPGCVDDGSVPHNYNYGIRVDASHVFIAYNTIYNYVWGIMSRGIDWPSYNFQDYNIAGNYCVLIVEYAQANIPGFVKRGHAEHMADFIAKKIDRNNKFQHFVNWIQTHQP